MQRSLIEGEPASSSSSSASSFALPALELDAQNRPQSAEGKHATEAVLKARAAGTRDAIGLDRLVVEAPTGEKDEGGYV
eukprot:SAG25_NODE_982_length_4418_cov_5.324149_5_plen_79_part_00